MAATELELRDSDDCCVRGRSIASAPPMSPAEGLSPAKYSTLPGGRRGRRVPPQVRTRAHAHTHTHAHKSARAPHSNTRSTEAHTHTTNTHTHTHTQTHTHTHTNTQMHERSHLIDCSAYPVLFGRGKHFLWTSLHSRLTFCVCVSDNEEARCLSDNEEARSQRVA